MSLYEDYETDPAREREGVECDFGHCVIRLARAGGANKRFTRALQKKAAPFRRALANGTMDNDAADALVREAFAETCVLSWKTSRKDSSGVRVSLEDGIEQKGTTELLPVTPQNVLATFANLPEFYADVQARASDIALYRQEQLEAEAGN